MKYYLSNKVKLDGALLFLIWPFFSLIVLSKYYKTKFYSNIIWAFFGLLGLFLIYSDTSTDAYRYAEWFQQFSNFDSNNKKNYFDDNSSLDYFKFISFYFVSFFTKNPKFYFTFIALFFGFFYKNMLYGIFNKIEVINKFSHIIILLSFLFILPFLSFKFIRFSTATIIFIYFTIKYFDSNKIKYQFYASTALLVHFSFVLPIGFLWAYNFMPKTKLYFFIFLITYFTTLVEFEYLKQLLQVYLPSNIIEAKAIYLNQNYKQEVEQQINQANWYIKYRSNILSFSSLFLLLFTYRDNQFDRLSNKNLLTFAFAFGTIANIVSVIPSGFRFLGVSSPLLWYVIICNYINNTLISSNYRIITSLVIVPVSVYNIIVGLRYFADDMPMDIFFSNYIIGLISGSEIPIINFLKGG